MTKGEKRELEHYQETLKHYQRAWTSFRLWMEEKHPEVVKEYDDYRLAKAMGFVE